MFPVISVVGKSNSGKTTLIEKIIPILKSQGFKVGVIKHASHQFDLDTKGKDSHRHKKAGAETVMTFSPKHLFLMKTLNSESLKDNLYHFKNIDILIIEGFKKEHWPKIEIFRPETHKEPTCLNDSNLLAIVSNVPLNTTVPCFKLDDILDISNFIVQKIIKLP